MQVNIAGFTQELPQHAGPTVTETVVHYRCINSHTYIPLPQHSEQDHPRTFKTSRDFVDNQNLFRQPELFESFKGFNNQDVSQSRQ